MGIIIQDDIKFDTGVNKTDCYCSFGQSKIILQKGASGYELSGMAIVWVSEAEKTAAAHCLSSHPIQLTITNAQLTGNVYTLLYNELKSQYSSTTDV